ncbi:MAG: hypothetical protein ACXADH_09540 [Candidatus Kariarchaeaceae archaeon]|jgi:hypothetical protein
MLNLLLIATLSHAEETQIVYKQKTEIDFEGVDVEGELVKPEGRLITEREVAKFNPLIKLRYDFNEEMSQSVNDIK